MSSWNAGIGSAKALQEEPEERLMGLVSPGISSVTQDVPRGAKKRTRQCIPKEEPDDDDLSDEPLNPTEKKRRLTVEQVNFLEQSFTADLKLEPERKALIAKQLGIRPRQVAIWFQNRRARWKNKQLEQDYEVLKAKYDAEVKEKESLMNDHEVAIENNKKLQAEVARLKSLLEGVESSGGGNTTPNAAESDEGLVKEEEVSGKSEVASPTKSIEDQSETQDSGRSYPTPNETVAADDSSLEEFNSSMADDPKLDPDYFLPFFAADDYYGITGPGPSFLAHQLGLCLEEAYNLFGSNEDQFGALPWGA